MRNAKGIVLKLAKLIGASALAIGMALSAHAQELGAAVTVSGDQGSVLVIRGGETFSLSEGDALFEGDKIVTREGGNTVLSAFGCSQTLGPQQTMMMTPQFCSMQPVQVAASGGGAGAAGGGAAGGASGAGAGAAAGGVSPVLLAGGALLVAGGIAAAASGGDDDDGGGTPVSP